MKPLLLAWITRGYAMLIIECPYCGARDEDEFTYGGPWDRSRPINPAALTDVQWADYLFRRDNPRGVSRERWRHTFGCRQWFVCERDTLTHQITQVLDLRDVPRFSYEAGENSQHEDAKQAIS